MDYNNQGNVRTAEFETVQKNSDIEYPWLIFQLKNNCYAINSEFVSSILILPDSIDALPEAPPYIKGIMNMRGTIIPLVQLRTIFGIQTLMQEHDYFTNMLEQRKQDHIYWAEELENCIKEGRSFTLATDPHQCAFGKWYDNFTSEVDSINHHMKKIEKPHQELHAAAKRVMDCTQACDNCQREICLKEVFNQVKNDYVPQIIALIDEAKDVFQQSIRETGIVLEKDGKQFSIIVDKVLFVEKLILDSQDEHSLHEFTEMRYVKGTARSNMVEGLILLIDDEALIELIEEQ